MFLLLLPFVAELILPVAIGGAVLATHAAGDAYKAHRDEQNNNEAAN